jgi:hypothetical protein
MKIRSSRSRPWSCGPTSPTLEAEVIAAYGPKFTATGYTIVDHPYLNVPALHDIFLAFRKQVLALDPCVTEEFLKLYVAYKADYALCVTQPFGKVIRVIFSGKEADY